MTLNWTVETMKRLESRGDPTICDRIVSRRRDRLMGMLATSISKDREIASVVSVGTNNEIDNYTVQVTTGSIGEEHVVHNPANDDDLLRRIKQSGDTIASIVHTHPRSEPAPSTADIVTAIETFKTIPSALIVGLVYTDIPPDIERVDTSTLDKSVAVWGIETPDGRPLNDVSADRLRNEVQQNFNETRDKIQQIKTEWQLTEPIVDLLTANGFNTCYHVLGRLEEVA